MTYQVGVDLGTGNTTVAVCRAGAVSAQSVPSTVFLGDDGVHLLGDAAERRALTDPDRVVRELTRRIGDPTPLLLGRRAVAAEALAARIVAGLLREVSAREGAAPDRVAVAHPAGWGAHTVAALRSALADHGVGPLVMVPAPLAAVQVAAVQVAAVQVAAAALDTGAVVAVHDLGAGSFEAAVVRRTASGAELVGRPGGVERLGGADVDEVVFEHVRRSLGPVWEALDGTDLAVLAAVARLRRECTAAKEALSVDTEVHIPVLLPGAPPTVRLGRAEFEEAIRPVVAETVDVLRAAIGSAGLSPADLTDVVLVGGSARIPLVAELVSGGLGRPVTVAADPTGAVAKGAALTARGPGGGNAGGPVPGGAAAAERAGGRPVAAPPPADPPTVVQAARPPKQARPFSSEPAPAARPRWMVPALAAGALVAVLAGGATAVSVAQLVNDAGATTPPAATTGATPGATTGSAAPGSVVLAPSAGPAPGAPRRSAPPPVRRTTPPPAASSADTPEPTPSREAPAPATPAPATPAPTPAPGTPAPVTPASAPPPAAPAGAAPAVDVPQPGA